MALSRHHGAFARPQTVEDIVREAQVFEFNPAVPLQQWLRAARMLLTEAAICEQDENYQMAYLYLYRHCELILGKLPQHPDYRNPRFKQELAQARKAVQRNLVKLEEWKPWINQEYQRYARAMERRHAERQRAQSEFDHASRSRQYFEQSRRGSLVSNGSGSGSPAEALNVHEHREFAVDLARREIRRRDATRQSTTQAGISPAIVASRRKGIAAHDYENEGTGQASNGIREAGRHLYQPAHQNRNDSNRTLYQYPSTSSYQYPSVPQKQGRMEWNTPPLQPGPISSRSRQEIPPARPAKESLYDYQRPELPASPPTVPSRAEHPSTTPIVPASPDHAPKQTYFKATATTESGAPLRTVLLPPGLRTTFLNLAHPNTLANVETCGILAATTISNALFITHLIVPDQTSTSDTCDTTESGDNALFDYCDANNLLVCGWIHTHPSQSCFLSSRDLHTSSGYQVMLPEAIAIVCAPRSNPDWGIFRLTDPPGLPHVLACSKPGIFHPHSESNLYTDAMRPGHVIEGPGLEFEVVDLREG